MFSLSRGEGRTEACAEHFKVGDAEDKDTFKFEIWGIS
jgi:hypothetical protein